MNEQYEQDIKVTHANIIPKKIPLRDWKIREVWGTPIYRNEEDYKADKPIKVDELLLPGMEVLVYNLCGYCWATIHKNKYGVLSAEDDSFIYNLDNDKKEADYWRSTGIIARSCIDMCIEQMKKVVRVRDSNDDGTV